MSMKVWAQFSLIDVNESLGTVFPKNPDLWAQFSLKIPYPNTDWVQKSNEYVAFGQRSFAVKDPLQSQRQLLAYAS